MKYTLTLLLFMCSIYSIYVFYLLSIYVFYLLYLCVLFTLICVFHLLYLCVVFIINSLEIQQRAICFNNRLSVSKSIWCTVNEMSNWGLEIILTWYFMTSFSL